MTAELAAGVAAAAGGTVRDWRPAPGGDINLALRVELTDGRRVFAKHRADPPAGFYAAEAAGLRWLADARALPVPRVLAVDDDFLALEWVDAAPRARDFDARLGEGLAHLHRAGATSPGATADGGPSFLGLLRLPNTPPGHSAASGPSPAAEPDRPAAPGIAAACDSRGAASAASGAANVPPPGSGDGFEPAGWPVFYARCRLEPLLRTASDFGAIGATTARRVNAVIDRIDDLAGPPEPPARLHGDLWSGNVMAGTDGGPLLVDPVAHGGHREVDLAMLELFGRPGPAVLAAYSAVHPLADGYRDRVPLWHLQPLLVHAILFGGGYGASVDAAARRVLDRRTPPPR